MMTTQNSYQSQEFEGPLSASNLISVAKKQVNPSEHVHPGSVQMMPRVEVHIENENKNTWSEFNKAGMLEMVISKSGRRMFPYLAIRASGLSPTQRYNFKMRIAPVDNLQYKRDKNGQWVGKKESASDLNQSPAADYTHPNSPATGQHWERAPILFKQVKLTNNVNAKADVLLKSMHKYMIEIIVEEVNSNHHQPNRSLTFSFPETTFVAVTAYLNKEIADFKIKHNPYARAHYIGSPGGSRPCLVGKHAVNKINRMMKKRCTQCSDHNSWPCANGTGLAGVNQLPTSIGTKPEIYLPSHPVNSTGLGMHYSAAYGNLCPGSTPYYDHGRFPPSNEANILGGHYPPSAGQRDLQVEDVLTAFESESRHDSPGALCQSQNGTFGATPSPAVIESIFPTDPQLGLTLPYQHGPTMHNNQSSEHLN